VGCFGRAQAPGTKKSADRSHIFFRFELTPRAIAFKAVHNIFHTFLSQDFSIPNHGSISLLIVLSDRLQLFAKIILDSPSSLKTLRQGKLFVSWETGTTHGSSCTDFCMSLSQE
jgi:hypothetical protein